MHGLSGSVRLRGFAQGDALGHDYLLPAIVNAKRSEFWRL